MGRSRNKRKIWEGKCCIFCGGTVPATTVEHAPPKIMFRDKNRPGGHEFPSCDNCNGGMSQLDQVAAMMLFSTAETFSPGTVMGEFNKTAIGVANNSPSFYHHLNLENDELAWRDSAGNEAFAVPVGRKMFSHWLNPWAAKQTCAMWYEQTGHIFGENQRILVRWLTNPLEVEDNFLALLRKSLPGSFNFSVKKQSVQDQFFYLFGIDEQKEFGAFFMVLHDTVGVFSIVAPSEYFHNDSRISYGELFCTGPNTGLCRTLH